jgi:hypothetical protein
VLRIWRNELGFATYHCVRCGESGHVREDSPADDSSPHVVEARAKHEEHAATQLQKALALWRAGVPAAGTIAALYLAARGYRDPIPATLRFLPPRGQYQPTMIAAFGLAHEVEPGVIAIDDRAVRGVHLTRLLPDGSGKAEAPDRPAKIMLGNSTGSPIVLAPPNDLLGLAITEGIEDGLALYEGTGLGVWVAGSASRLPALGDIIPGYVDCVSICADADEAGQRGAYRLARVLRQRGVELRIVAA